MGMGKTCRKLALFGIRRLAVVIRKISYGNGLVAVDDRAKTPSTIEEAKRLIERSRILCATAADLTRESVALRISILKSLERKRKALRTRAA